MKKVLALILVVLMSVSVLAACGDKGGDKTNTTSDVTAQGGNSVSVTIPVTTTEAVADTLTQETLTGRWNMTFNMENVTALIAQMMGDESELEGLTEVYGELLKGATVNIVIDFKENNKYDAMLDTASAETAVQVVFDNTIAYLKNGGLENIMALSGTEITEEELEAALAEQGLTMEDYYDLVAEQMKATMSAENFFALDENDYMETDGDYELKGDILYIDMDEEEMGMSSEFKYSFDGTAITLLENVDGETHAYTGSVLTKIQ